ncbi:hypothetical protein EV189_1681 [Motilibacter rhizosphaerae]|uniref:Integral membrane protein n=1 Tax=Motilibacter rhizosphaerae TaxID=598652 RepID=A0A4Q7NU12_9ACTN|nr:hypothetical protein [Motilibacter rhizosphaerae]RZS89902.1 hypothetical protein EV189_1681 [Motilibacter rhizosphaerae]
MPVPVFADPAAERPSGLVPPAVDLSGVTEIRVHGVGGSTPAALLGDLAPQQVAGDSTAGFYRTADSHGRHVEGYSWGGITSRSSTRVLWLLLLPFVLANLAGWTCSPGVRRRPWAGFLFRWFARVAALAMTLNLVVLVALLSEDLVGYQCSSQQSCSRRHWELAPLRWSSVVGHPERALALATVVPLALLGVLAVLSVRNRARYDGVVSRRQHSAEPHPSAASLPKGLQDQHFWHGAPAVRRLSHLHLGAGTATVALLLTATAARPGGVLLRVLAGGVVVAAVGLLALDPALPDRRADRPAAAVLLAGCAAAAWALVAAWVAPAYDHLPGPLPGLRRILGATYAGVLAPMLLLGLLVLAVVVLDRAEGRPEHRLFRWAPPLVALATGLALLNAVLLGIAIRFAALLGEVRWTNDPVRDGGSGTVVALSPFVRFALPWLTVVPLAAVLLFAAVEVASWAWHSRPSAVRALAVELGADAGQRPGHCVPEEWWVPATTEGPRFVRQHALARRRARAVHDLSYLLSVLAVLDIGIPVVVLATSGTPHSAWSGRVVDLGTLIAGSIPLVLLGLLRAGYRNLETRRRIGILWDVGTFWPRAFHPLGPPSYAERAVPELQERMGWIADSGGRVVLAAHSQGTVLAAAALLQDSGRPARDRVSLATFGSPLVRLYAWAFPAYVSPAVLATLDQGLSGWRNFCYASDMIGGPVHVPSVDVALPDPQSCWHRYGQPPPPPLGHSGYWQDARVWREIDGLAAGLVGPATVPPARIDLTTAQRVSSPPPPASLSSPPPASLSSP